MTKPFCGIFPNCAPLAKKFGVNNQILNVFINLYNLNVPNEERISNEKNYSAEELEDLYNKIAAQREQNKKNRKYNSKERDLIIKSIGGPEALAFKELSSMFSAEEMQELSEEYGRLALMLLREKAEIELNTTIENYLKTYGSDVVTAILDRVIKDSYYKKLQEAYSVMNGAIPVENSNIQTVDDARKVFKPGRYSARVYESLKIYSLPVINRALGVRIHGDFSLDADGTTSYELADSIKDTEAPMQERYMQALDAQGLEDSLSGIICRVLMQLPREKITVTTETREVKIGGTSREELIPITNTEIVKSTVMGQPLYSDPRVVARKLASILSGIIGEQDMMDTLRSAGYENLYNALNANNALRTTFFQEFNKYAQTYRSVELNNQADGTVAVNVITLGRSKNEGVASYKNRLKTGAISKNAIYELKDDKPQLKSPIYFDAVKRWFNSIFYTTAENGEKVTSKSSFDLAAAGKKEAYLTIIMEYLNIPVTEKGVGILLSDESKLDSFIKSVDNFLSHGEKLLGNLSSTNKNLNRTFFGNANVSSAIGNIMSIVEATPRNFYSTRITYQGSSFSTNIMNSPLSILSKKVNALYDRVVNGKTQEDLTNYLTARFLHSPQYMTSRGRILNRWLRDFMGCSTERFEPCAKSIFGFSRDLGIGGTEVEKISDQSHMLLLLDGYLGGRNYATTEDVLVKNDKDSIDEAITLSNANSKRYIISGTPYYYQRGKRHYRTDTAYIPSFITGDTNAIRQIRTIHYYEDEILDDMYDLFLADKENQKLIKYFNNKGIVFSANGKEAYTSKQVKRNGEYSRKSNADKFGILQFLNKKKDKGTWYDYFLKTAAKKQGISAERLTPDEILHLEADNTTFKEVVSEYLNEGFKDFKKQLEDLGLLEKTSEGKYVNFNEFVSGAKDEDAYLDRKLRDFYFDYKFSQYNQAHLMQVNPLFLNGVEDYQKRNKGILTNGSALSMEATDNQGNSLWGYNPESNSYDFTSKVVYFKDVIVPMDDKSVKVLTNYFTKLFSKTTKSLSKAKEKAEKHMSKFKSNSLTDGQAFRSLDSYRKVLMSAGKQFWTDSHEKAYNDIMNIVAPIRAARKDSKIIPLSRRQIQKIEDAMVIMEPIKPINDGTEIIKTDLGDVNIPFQFKYAEVPIIPELLPVGSKLRELADYMIDNNIDMIASDKCLKKGCFGEVDFQYKRVGGRYVDAKGDLLPGMDADGHIIDNGTQTAAEQLANRNNRGKFVEWDKGTSVNDIFKGHKVDDNDSGFTVHRVSMENYLIQSNITDHTDGNSIVGVQGRKIGTGAIINREDYNYTIGPENTQINGKKLARLYGAAHAIKYAKSYSKFVDRIENTSDIVSDLIYNILNNGRGNYGIISRLTLEDGSTPTIPFSELSTASDINSNLISIFKKTVIRQLISGGSIVQASALGRGKTALSDTGLHAIIKWENEKEGLGVPIAMEAEMPFNFHFIDEDGNLVALKYEDYCDENGYFLDEEGNPITEGNYSKKAKIEVDFPGIRDIIAYRIPTEMEYSMFHLKIAKCSPKTGDNTIKLPAECTTIAGFDFDIDKLFLMRHNYKASRGLSEYDVWTKFYEDHQDIWKALKTEWEMDGRKENVPYYSYWNNIMAKYPSWIDDYANKDKCYQDTKAKLQLEKGLINKNKMDYNIEPKDLVNLSENELDNLLIDCMISILSDESTVGDRYTVGGFEGASSNAKFIRLVQAGEWDEEEPINKFAERVDSMEDVKPEYDYSEPLTAITFKEQNQIAGTLIGIFANDNVNAFISKGLASFRIAKSKNRILFGSLLDGVTELDGQTENIDSSDLGLNFLHTSVNGNSIKRTLAELLAAAVDAVKDPVLNYLNLNSITADAAAMLVRLGYSTRDIGLLFNQPIIKRMCLYMNRTGETNTRRALIMALEEMGAENPAELFSSKAIVDSSQLTSQALAKALTPNASPNIKFQESVAQLFNSIMQTKSEFSNFVQETRNTSSNTVKSRFEDYISSEGKSGRQFNRIEIKTSETIGHPITRDITEEQLTNPSKMKEMIDKYKDHPFLYENVVADIIRNAMYHMMNKYTLYTTSLYRQYEQQLSGLVAPWGLSGDQINTLFKEIPVMMLSSLNGDFNPNYMSDGKVKNAVKYVAPNHFLERFIKFNQDNPELLSLPILEIADIDPISGENNPRIMLKYSRGMTETEKLSITTSWDYLMSLGGEAAEIAKGLYLHFYYTRGLNPETNVYMELAPVSVLKALQADKDNNISYADFYSKEKNIAYDNLDINNPDGWLNIQKKLYQFLISHSSDDNFIKRINLGLSAYNGNNKDNSVIFTQNGEDNNLDLVKLQTVKDGDMVMGTIYSPVIKIEGKTYVLAVLNGVDENGKPTYAIDYNNYKSAASGTASLTYIPATEVSNGIDDEYREVLNPYVNSQNSLIFKEVTESISLSRIVDSEEVTTDTTDSTDGVGEAYEEAKSNTKDDEVESSDGRPKCHRH